MLVLRKKVYVVVHGHWASLMRTRVLSSSTQPAEPTLADAQAQPESTLIGGGRELTEFVRTAKQPSSNCKPSRARLGPVRLFLFLTQTFSGLVSFRVCPLLVPALACGPVRTLFRYTLAKNDLCTHIHIRSTRPPLSIPGTSSARHPTAQAQLESATIPPGAAAADAKASTDGPGTA